MKNACFFSRIFVLSAFLLAYSGILQATNTANEVSNLAQNAFVTASKVSVWEKLSSLYDGFEPQSSTDRTHGIYGNWDGEAEYGALNWVQYEWPSTVTLNNASVYWYNDGGGLIQPTTSYLEHWVDGGWVRTGSMNVVLDQWNTLELAGLQTTKIRLYMQSATSTGIIELKVMGVQGTVDPSNVLEYKRQIQCYLDSLSRVNLGHLPRGYFRTVSLTYNDAKFRLTAVDTLAKVTTCLSKLQDLHQELKQARKAWLRLSACVDSARILLADSKLENRERLQNAYNEGYASLYSNNAFLFDVSMSYQSLYMVVSTYYFNPFPYNLASVATVSTSYMAPWESLQALNDGYCSTTSQGNGVLRYTNWKGQEQGGLTNWVQYDWDSDKAVRTVSVFWYTDGEGVTMPDTAYVEYWKDDQWHLSGSIGVMADTFNILPCELITNRLRLSMKSKTATGILELKAEGYETAPAPQETSALKDVLNGNGLELFCSQSDGQTWTLTNPSGKMLTIKVYDVTGRTESHFCTDLQQFVFPKSAFSGRGVHFVRIIDANGTTILVRKILTR